MRTIGDRVFVVADNYGIAGTITDVREQEPRWKIRTDDGQETWYFTYEVNDE